MLKMGAVEVAQLCPGQIWAFYEVLQQEKAADRINTVHDLMAAMAATNPLGASDEFYKAHIAQLTPAAGFEGSGYTEQQATPL